MDFNLTAEQENWQSRVREFAMREIAPRAVEVDAQALFPYDNLFKMAAAGLMGVPIPQNYAGAGLDTVSFLLTVEELTRVCASTGVICSVNTGLASSVVLNFGGEDQKQKYLTLLAQGKKLGAFALTEPGAGSDPSAMVTRAERQGNGYLLNGHKILVANGVAADYFIVFALTNPELGVKGISTFLLERGDVGLIIGGATPTLGMRGLGTNEIRLENCQVLAEQLIGKEGDGYKIALATLDGSRLGIAAQSLGLAEAALGLVRDYAKSRVQFGKPIAQHQMMLEIVADMATELEAARLLTYRAATLKDQSRRFTKEAAMAKLFASEMVVRATNQALQIMGGLGYTGNCPAERWLRDARVTTIYEGTSQIQKIIISGAVLAG